MKLKIGENIKRLRKSKNITQEQLAQRLNLSCAAVSKWESGDSYPDITMLFPLAQLFCVSVDELMGYDAARVEEEIEKILVRHRDLQVAGHNDEASLFISQAREKYPNDYRIINRYMWDAAGGYADNHPDNLLDRQEEFLKICNAILQGCTDEVLRLDAMTMKAKLLHASGNTLGAMEILSQFPSWPQCAGQKAEQLFAKDTPEFRYWLHRNLYELSDAVANKMIKTIWYDESITMEERVLRGETLGDMFTALRKQSKESAFVIEEHMAFAELAGKLTFSGGKLEDIIRIRSKSLIAAEALTAEAEKNEIIEELLKRTYKTNDLCRWTVDWLETAPQAPLARLRENAAYMAMLEKYKKH